MKPPTCAITPIGAITLACLLISSPCWAQESSKLQRTAVGILNDAHKNEGKEVVLDCAYVRPWWHSSGVPSLAQAQGLSVFLAYDEDGKTIPVLIRLGDANALTKQFGSKTEYLPGYRTRTRKLKGIVAPWGQADQNIYRHYLLYEGAKKWVNSAGGRQGGAEEVPPKQAVAFDDSPMRSFSYDGKRLNEARVVDVGAEGVVVTSKDSISVIVPLDRAIKMPDLRMRAKDAMEAALSADVNP